MYSITSITIGGTSQLVFHVHIEQGRDVNEQHFEVTYWRNKEEPTVTSREPLTVKQMTKVIELCNPFAENLFRLLR